MAFAAPVFHERALCAALVIGQQICTDGNCFKQSMAFTKPTFTALSLFYLDISYSGLHQNEIKMLKIRVQSHPCPHYIMAFEGTDFQETHGPSSKF